MLRSITYKQLREWQVFYSLEPFDENRREVQQMLYQVALISQTLANVNRDSKKHPQPYKLEEFVIRLEEETRQKSEEPLTSKQIQERQQNLMKIMAAMHGETEIIILPGVAEEMLKQGVVAKDS